MLKFCGITKSNVVYSKLMKMIKPKKILFILIAVLLILFLGTSCKSSKQKKTTSKTDNPTKQSKSISNSKNKDTNVLKNSEDTNPPIKTEIPEIKILFFGSWEAALLPVILEGKKQGGLDNFEMLLKKISNKHTILCSTGDFFPGDVTDRRPATKALDLLGLKVSALSNLELNYGPKKLKKKLEKANFKVVSCNIYQGQKRLFPPYFIEVLGGLKIAFIGVTSQSAATQIVPEARESLLFKDPAVELDKVLKEVQKLADILVVLSNLPYEQDLKMAQAHPNLHLIIGRYDVNASHSYKWINSVVVTRTFKKLGTQLGEIILKKGEDLLINNAAKFYDVGPQEAKTEELASEKLVHEWQKQEQDRLRELCYSESLLVGEYKKVRQQETNLGNLIADILLATRENAQVALVNSGSIRASIPKGKWTYGQLLDMLPYKNKIVELAITGEELREVLENSVARYEKISGAFLQVGGLSFTFRPSLPAFSRVQDIWIQGEKIEPKQTYQIVTVDYIVSGGDDYLMLKDKKLLFTSTFTIQKAIVEFLTKAKSVNPQIEGRIKIQK